jgi:hypothetical protein
MTTVTPEGEAIRNAIKWISASLTEEHPQPIKQLIAQAILRFDLSPLDGEFLARFYQHDSSLDK